jgi:hypothetical protein
MEHPLTLPDPKANTKGSLNMVTQQSSIPYRLAVSKIGRRPDQVLSQRFQLLFTQLFRPPRAQFLSQPIKALLTKPIYPIVNASRGIPQEIRNFVGTAPIHRQQYGMEAVVVFGVIVTSYLLAQKVFDPLRIFESNFPHSHCLHIVIQISNGMLA